MQSGASQSNKIVPLESLRGVAAFIVVAGHFVLGFFPQYHGVAPGAIPGKQLQELPWFVFINSVAWVNFFFVLSGFVLSYRFFSTRSNTRLFYSAVKRWPRLFPLALISTILSFLLIKLGLYTYYSASRVTQSNWMENLAWSSKGGRFEVTFWEAFSQGFYKTFFFGESFLNSSLWTMHYEFIGSLIVFAIIPLFNRKKLSTGVFIYLIALALVVFGPTLGSFETALIIPFLTGCFFSFYFVQHRNSVDHERPNIIILILALIFSFIALGFLGPPKGFYSFLNVVPLEYLTLFQISLHTLASIILVYYVLVHKGMYRILDGKVGRFLGRISFALYVIHVPIMFSVSTAIFLKLVPSFGHTLSAFMTFFASLPILLFVSWLMSLLDEKWRIKINHLSSIKANLRMFATK